MIERPSVHSPDRRRFLAASAAAVAAAAVRPVSAAASGRAASDRELRVGLVGCGGRGTGAAQQALQTSADVRLVAVADAFADRVEQCLATLARAADGVAERVTVDPAHRYVGFDACDRLLEQDVDVVILATPPHFRPAHFEAAVAAGKHVFMEKPVAVDGHGVRQVLAAADSADEKRLCVGVGLQRHHQYGYVALMDLVHRGAIGDVVAARCYWNMGYLWHREREDGWSDMEWQLRNWLYFDWLSGDHIVEQHIHNLDVVNWAKRAHPVSAQGMGGRQVRVDPVFGNIFDHHAVEYEYADGSRLFSQCRQIAGCSNAVSEHLIGTNGRADMHTGAWRLSGGFDWRYDGEKNNPYQTEHDALFAAIRAGEPFNEARQGAEATLTAVLGRMATYTGQVVTWEEALASPRLGPTTYAWGDVPIAPVPMPGQR